MRGWSAPGCSPRAGRRPSSSRPGRRDPPGASPGSVLVDDSLDTVFWIFPEDRKLQGLAELTSPSPPRGRCSAAPWSRSELVAYTPEKAATARCEDASGRVVGFAKVQVGDEGRRSVDVLRAARRGIANDGPLRLPDAVAYLPDRHMALFTPAPGRPLHQLPRDRWPEAMAALGAGLAVLHRQPVDGFAPFARLDPCRLDAAGEVLRQARPDLAPLVQSLVETLLLSPPAQAHRCCCTATSTPRTCWCTTPGSASSTSTRPGPDRPRPSSAACWRACGARAPGTRSRTTPLLRRPTRSSRRTAQAPGHRDLLWYAAAALLVERAARAVHRVDVRTLAVLEQVLVTALRWAEDRRTAGDEAAAAAVLLPALGGARAPGALDAPGRRPEPGTSTSPC